MKSGKTAGVVYMRMRADYGANLQPVFAQYYGDAPNFVAGVHDDSFVRNGIAQDRAIALQNPDGNYLVDQFLFHRRQYTSKVCCAGTGAPRRIPIIC